MKRKKSKRGNCNTLQWDDDEEEDGDGDDEDNASGASSWASEEQDHQDAVDLTKPKKRGQEQDNGGSGQVEAKIKTNDEQSIVEEGDNNESYSFSREKTFNTKIAF
jgi:hypothetical protein